jgi:hypothetical protein
MKNIFNVTSVFVAILSLSGCSSTPSANMTSVGGKFYMVGDPNCAYYKQRDENSILCTDKDKQITGYRNALTDQEIQYRMHREKIDAEATNSMLNFGKNFGSSSNTVNCVRIGSYGFNREVKTFNGMVCPFGYIPNY